MEEVGQCTDRIGQERQIAAGYSGKHGLIAFSERKVVGAGSERTHYQSAVSDQGGGQGWAVTWRRGHGT